MVVTGPRDGREQHLVKVKQVMHTMVCPLPPTRSTPPFRIPSSALFRGIGRGAAGILRFQDFSLNTLKSLDPVVAPVGQTFSLSCDVRRTFPSRLTGGESPKGDKRQTE